MPSKLLAIAGNTFLETIRQPIYGVLTWVALGWLALSPSVVGFSLETGGDSKIMKDVGLSTLLLYGLLVSVFSATGVITREIESFTVLTVISKPVSRTLFLVGKYLGVAAAVFVGQYLLCLTLFLTAEHGVMETNADKLDQPVLVLSGIALLTSLVVATFTNYIYGWHFPTTMLGYTVTLGTVALIATLFLDRQWRPHNPLLDVAALQQTVYAAIAVFIGVLVLAAFAVALSTRWSQVLTLVGCSAILALGLLSDYWFGQRVAEGLPFTLLHAVIPNFQFFSLGDAITQEQIIPFTHVLRVAAYGLLYSAAVLCAGVALFQTREVG
jgi:ABC-2 type transport system permease protein